MCTVTCMTLKNMRTEGRRGGLSPLNVHFGSGHDLAVRGSEPRVGLCADGSQPGARFGFCVYLSPCPSPATMLSLSISQK